MGRETSLAGACLLIGGSLGGFFGAASAGQTFSPASYYWPLVWGCLAGGALLVGLYLWLGHRVDEFHKSESLDISFDGPDSVMDFPATGRVNLGSGMVGYYFSPQPSNPDVRLVRLRVRNARQKPLDRVHVRTDSIREVAHPDRRVAYNDWLKWMHDDGPEHSESVQGRTLGPTGEAYLDFASKAISSDEISIQYARDHLRQTGLPATAYLVRVVGEAVDAASGRPAAAVTREFQVDVEPDGRLRVTHGDSSDDVAAGSLGLGR